MSRRALLVGINNFVRPQWRLRGCANDTAEMQTLLQTYFGFGSEQIRILRDRDATKQGIFNGLAWLLSDYAGDGSDIRVFHFSSHGTQVEDQNRDEWEGFDEVIVPFDHDWDAPFRDDDLWEQFKQVPENVNFTFIADCCHSGNMQRAAPEVEFHPRYLNPTVHVHRRIAEQVARRDDELKTYQALQLASRLQGVPPAEWADKLKELLVVTEAQFRKEHFDIRAFERQFLLAACEDRQTAADACIEGEWRGALTWALGQAIRQSEGKLTYEDLIGRTGNILGKYDQRPQLECPADLRRHPFLTPLG